MAYHNTGYARRKKLTVTKGEYSQEYNICTGFTYNSKVYPSLSDDEFARLLQLCLWRGRRPSDRLSRPHRGKRGV